MGYWSPSDQGITVIVQSPTATSATVLVTDNTAGWQSVNQTGSITLPDDQVYQGISYVAQTAGNYLIGFRNKLTLNSDQSVLQWAVGIQCSGNATSEDISPYELSQVVTGVTTDYSETLTIVSLLQLAEGDIVFPFTGYVQAGGDPGGLDVEGYPTGTFWVMQLGA